MPTPSPDYDSLLVLSFGGPEGPDDVIPFLENVMQGRHVPRERMLEVAEHYQHFGGRSPINAQNRELIAKLKTELAVNGPDLPVYWGNRNWHPLLADTLRQMQADGRRRALAFVTSAFGSYSGCRQYLDDIARAQAEVGAAAPAVDKLRLYYNHPGFIDPMIDNVRRALCEVPEPRRADAALIFTAHSVPSVMAALSPYVDQLEEAVQLVARAAGRAGARLVYQSRSGPPTQPWLEPDILDELRRVRGQGAEDAVVVPIGFISDHMEVLYDLDTEAKALCEQIGLRLVRAATVGSDPRFVAMIGELARERIARTPPRTVGDLGPWPTSCYPDCCPAPRRP